MNKKSSKMGYNLQLAAMANFSNKINSQFTKYKLNFNPGIKSKINFPNKYRNFSYMQCQIFSHSQFSNPFDSMILSKIRILLMNSKTMTPLMISLIKLLLLITIRVGKLLKRSIWTI